MKKLDIIKMHYISSILETKIKSGEKLMFNEIINFYKSIISVEELDLLNNSKIKESYATNKFYNYENEEISILNKIRELRRIKNVLLSVDIIPFILLLLAIFSGIPVLALFAGVITGTFIGPAIYYQIQVILQKIKYNRIKEMKKFYNFCLLGIRNTRELDEKESTSALNNAKSLKSENITLKYNYNLNNTYFEGVQEQLESETPKNNVSYKRSLLLSYRNIFNKRK